eukprot:scaffold4.g4698.t1
MLRLVARASSAGDCAADQPRAPAHVLEAEPGAAAGHAYPSSSMEPPCLAPADDGPAAACQEAAPSLCEASTSDEGDLATVARMMDIAPEAALVLSEEELEAAAAAAARVDEAGIRRLLEAAARGGLSLEALLPEA